MALYDINGYIISPDGADSTYFEVVNETAGVKLQPKSDYQFGYYRGMMLNTYFQSFFKDNFTRFAPTLSLIQTNGKSLWIGGDSLHQYSGDTICKYNQYFGFKTLVNAGYAGSTWTGTGTGGGINRVTELVAAGVPYDVFILAWGTNNDSGGNGTIDDEESNADGCTMVSAMKWCITQLRTTFRYSAIGVIIPPPKTTNEGMKEKGDLMIDVCKLLHVPYVDMREYLSMDDMGSDGVHLGYGAIKYGAAEAKLILDICPYGDPLQ